MRVKEDVAIFWKVLVSTEHQVVMKDEVFDVSKVILDDHYSCRFVRLRRV